MSSTPVRLHFVREGAGPTVVLSHALGCDLHMWDGVARALRADFTVLRYDHRNHGRSQKIAGPIDVDMLADDVAGLIQREARDEDVHFVGLSLGGMTAQALARRHPGLLKDMVVANSAAFYPDASGWRSRIKTVAAEGIGAIASAVVERWLTPEWSGSEDGRSARDELLAALGRNDPAGYIESCKAVAGIDFRASNRLTRVPTLVVAGARDLATPPLMSEEIANAILGARLVSLNAAHLSAVEMPDAFAALLRQFWSRDTALEY